MSEITIRDYHEVYRLGMKDQRDEIIKLCHAQRYRPVTDADLVWNNAMTFIIKYLERENDEQRAK